MFEKHRNNSPEPSSSVQQPDDYKASPSAPVSSGRAAVIGPGIHITGDEDVHLQRIGRRIEHEAHPELGTQGGYDPGLRKRLGRAE